MGITQVISPSKGTVHLLAPMNVPEFISIVIETRHVTSVLDSVQLATTSRINTTTEEKTDTTVSFPSNTSKCVSVLVST